MIELNQSDIETLKRIQEIILFVSDHCLKFSKGKISGTEFVNEMATKYAKCGHDRAMALDIAKDRMEIFAGNMTIKEFDKKYNVNEIRSVILPN